MANNPKKIVDPTEAALSAIQEALKVRDDEDQPDHRGEGIPEPHGLDDETWHDAPPPPSTYFEPDPIGAPAGDRRAFPANDDQQSIGQVLQALQKRPARTSYFIASILSAVWIVGCIALSYAYLGDVGTALGPN